MSDHVQPMLNSEAAPDGAPPDAVARLPGFREEALAFWQLRGWLVRAQVRQALARSRLRLSLIVGLSLLLWCGMFWLFADGFRFLKITVLDEGVYDSVVQSILSTFFAALMVMLVFSSVILVYGFLFRGRDLTLLLSLPARTERVFVQKFQETIFFSGWAFLLLGSPMLLAYGIVEHSPWYYYVVLLPFLVAFAYIPASVGALICLLVVHFFPRRRHIFLSAAVVVGVIVITWIGWSLATGPRGAVLTPAWFQRTIGRLQFSEQQLLPSWWLSAGLLEAARGGWNECVMFLSVLIANALLLGQGVVWAARRWYREAFNRLQTMTPARRRKRPIWLDRAIMRYVPLSLTVRLMLVKDARLFRRDASQWSQFLLFFALLGFYFLNIRQFGAQARTVAWDNMMSFVNLTVVGLILSTLTTRHVFPMISLEGQRLWLVGILGLRRDTVLWSKLVFAVSGTLIPCGLLVLISDLMLSIPWRLQLAHQATCLLFCLGLSGIAVGLGAKMPDMREESAPRIAAGFGGTLNLVVSSLFVVLIVVLAAMPWHLHVLAGHDRAAELLAERPNLRWWLCVWLWGGSAAAVTLGAISAVVPLWFGFRAFRKLET